MEVGGMCVGVGKAEGVAGVGEDELEKGRWRRLAGS